MGPGGGRGRGPVWVGGWGKGVSEGVDPHMGSCRETVVVS